jgi:hypothetical protein
MPAKAAWNLLGHEGRSCFHSAGPDSPSRKRLSVLIYHRVSRGRMKRRASLRGEFERTMRWVKETSTSSAC